MPSVLETLGLEKELLEKLERKLCAEGISSPIVLRDHRKRGPVYWSLIFDAAKGAPAIFGLPPLKMINFNGIYLVDSKDYELKLCQVAEKLGSLREIEKFSNAKGEADAALNSLTKRLRGANFQKLSVRQLALLIKEFYGTRYSYTQYSFFFDTVTKSTDLILQRLFRSAGFPESERQLAYVPSNDTIEFVYLEKKKDFLQKHNAELNKPGFAIEKASKGLAADFALLMDEFADLNFVNFSSPLESGVHFLGKIQRQGALGENASRIQVLQKEKEALLAQLSLALEEKGIKENIVQGIFGFAGNLSAWESGARHTWTRLHRAAKPMIEEIGKRAEEKGLLNNPEEIFEKEIGEIISIAEGLEKN